MADQKVNSTPVDNEGMSQLFILIKSFMSQVNEYNEKVVDMSSILKEHIEITKNLNKSVEDIKSELNSLKVQVENLKESENSANKEISNMQQKIEKIESSCVTSEMIPSDQVIKEFNNRLSKINKLILYNVPETLTKSDNFEYLNKLFLSIDHNLDNLHFKRLNNNNSNKNLNRPVQISTNNNNNIKIILANYNKLPKGMTVTQDRTLLQRQQYKKLLNITNENNKIHPNNLKKVKYIQGVPKIVAHVNTNKEESQKNNNQVLNKNQDKSTVDKENLTFGCAVNEENNNISNTNFIKCNNHHNTSILNFNEEPINTKKKKLENKNKNKIRNKKKWK